MTGETGLHTYIKMQEISKFAFVLKQNLKS